MLDEETGVRGYAATHNRLFLQPYNAALQPFATTLRTLRSDLTALKNSAALASVNDMGAANSDYLRTVASRLLNESGENTEAIERHGKNVVDRFRADVAHVDALLTLREQIVNREVQSAIDRIGLLTGGAVALVLLISLLYAVQQANLAARIERERLRASEQRGEADVLRAAYATEKRIADTLQEAFVQRPLPTHPTFRFSATYVPASEEAKVGGDWYDALELPANRVLFAIGDVTGHGIEAAVTMNRVRQTLISSALLDPMPAALLALCHCSRIWAGERSLYLTSSIPVAMVCENLLRTVLTCTPLVCTDQLTTGAWKPTNWSTYSFSQCRCRKVSLAPAVASKKRLSNGALNLA